MFMLSLYALSNLHGSTLGGGSVVGFPARSLSKYLVWLPLFWVAEIHLAIDYLTMQLWVCGINFFLFVLILGLFQSICCNWFALYVMFWIPLWCHLISKFYWSGVLIFMPLCSGQSLIASLCVDPATVVQFYLFLINLYCIQDLVVLWRSWEVRIWW